MATYTFAKGSSGTLPLANSYGVPVRVAAQTVDLASVLTAAGTNAFSNGDIIEAVVVPGGSVILGAGLKVVEAFSTNAAVLNFGIAGGSNFMQAQTVTTTGFQDGSNAASFYTNVRLNSTDTIDIKIVSGSAGLTSGRVVAYAIYAPIEGTDRQFNVARTTEAEVAPT